MLKIIKTTLKNPESAITLTGEAVMLTYYKVYEIVGNYKYCIFFTCNEYEVSQYMNKDEYLIKTFTFIPEEFLSTILH